MGFGITVEGIRDVIREKTTIFFDKLAIRGSYGKPYAEAIRRGHTKSYFSMGLGPAAEAIRGGHTRRPYGQFYFDTLFP